MVYLESLVAEHLFLIAGPCVIESEWHCMKMAEAISTITRRLGMPYIFKASYDKANRTSIKSYRGPGLQEGLKILAKVRNEFEVPVLTDIHDATQASIAAEVVDILQIPAFLCRQTDLLIAAARTGRAVNVKKGQFLAPWDIKNVVEKLTSARCKLILLTERGTSFGYNNLVVDMRSFPIMREFGCPVVFDVTHSLQRPGGLGTATDGESKFIEYLARAGVACGIDGVFMEVHDNPAEALSDGPNALPLSRLEPLLESLLKIDSVVRSLGR
ncbi:MAG: 3-deoxy-8-phosphooctulonate synthase [Acidobacteriota bacterium]|nr:3-deoxy-8-phosphooctulonate synthase [Blastocatellia bacterium]MDW8411122.1 3-deoxy-8-phosphooctulonate synthase [Acidobacteriota bacterium]